LYVPCRVVIIVISSVKHSRDVSDAGNQVDGSSRDNHSGFTSKALSGSSVDLLTSDIVDFLGVLLEGEVAEGLEVSSDLFESVSRVFKRHHDVHLEEVLGSVELSVGDRFSESVKFLNSNLKELSRVRSGSLNVDSEKTGIGEVGVDGRGSINESVLLHKVGNSAAIHALAGTTGGESSSASDEGVHEVESGHILVVPWDGLEGEGDRGSGGLSPGSGLSTDVLRGLSLVLLHMLGDGEVISKSLLDEVNVLSVVLDTGSDDEALLGGDVVHNELLEDTGVEVADVVLQTVARHTQGVVTVGCAEEVLLVVGEGVVVGQVLVEVVSLLVLGLGNVSSKNRSGLEGDVNHHLEHVNDIVLDAVTSEVGSLLIVVHLHGTTGHLDHAVVNGFVSVLESLQVGVLKGEERSRGFWGFISSSDIDKEAHVYASREGLALGEDGKSVVKVCYIVRGCLVSCVERLVAL